MKKIGIMSMQRISNYGSFLQAYGLKKIMESLNTKVYFIDYHPGYVLDDKVKTKGVFRKFAKIWQTLKIKAPFKAKLEYILFKRNYGNRYYPLLGMSNQLNYDTENLNLLIIGSDEVFNCLQSNPNVGFSQDLFGANSKAHRLITYAASFGNTTKNEIIKYNKQKQLSKWLQKFDKISVRDKNSEEIIRWLVPSKQAIISNLDPVLIYRYFEKENIPEVKVNYKYLILYGYNGRFTLKECKIIKNFAKSRNLKILCIGGVQDYCDCFINCKPLEVLSYFKAAEYVVTDTFHGTIMSIITHRKFVTVIRNSEYGNSQKLNDLLKRLKLENRIIKNIIDLKFILKKGINYDNTDRIIKLGRQEAIKYLKEQLNKS